MHNNCKNWIFIVQQQSEKKSKSTQICLSQSQNLTEISIYMLNSGNMGSWFKKQSWQRECIRWKLVQYPKFSGSLVMCDWRPHFLLQKHLLPCSGVLKEQCSEWNMLFFWNYLADPDCSVIFFCKNMNLCWTRECVASVKVISKYLVSIVAALYSSLTE